MKNIGIVTYYYRSNNYGGNLQAYALATYINKFSELHAEQICFDFSDFEKKDGWNAPKNNTTVRNIRVGHIFKTLLKKTVYSFKKIITLNTYKKPTIKFLDMLNASKFALRINAFSKFNSEIIPHSSSVYKRNNIEKCNCFYDIFITGSDQVWSTPDDVFMLGFANNKTKISYAASIARAEIPQNHKDFIKNKITDFKRISVRDKTDKSIVSSLTDLPVDIVLDPVFLLDKEDWDKISSKRQFSNTGYIFCYFLGASKKYKKIVRKFAKIHNLKIVFIPNFRDNENKTIADDLFFGDYRPYDVSPSDFLTLIRNSKYIFTDSFHALAFSLIYNKNFYVFDRISKWGKMNSRISNLLGTVGLSERFCCGEDKENIDYILKLREINFASTNIVLENEKLKSRDFLLKSIYDN